MKLENGQALRRFKSQPLLITSSRGNHFFLTIPPPPPSIVMYNPDLYNEDRKFTAHKKSHHTTEKPNVKTSKEYN